MEGRVSDKRRLRSLKKDVDSLFDEILKNAKADRARLESYLDGTCALANQNPEVAAVLAENIVEIVDTLTKINISVIEVAKTQVKRDSFNKDAGKFSDEETQDVFDDIDEEHN